MNLQDLHTPQPLRDADFAAIRARVKAEIAQRNERPWFAMLLRFAFAASLLVMLVPYVKERAPEVPVIVVAREKPLVITKQGALASSPADVATPRAVTPGGRRDATRSTGETPALHVEASRIEIITADPTIRIIWITPKESS